jgi:hypothetical protein
MLQQGVGAEEEPLLATIRWSDAVMCCQTAVNQCKGVSKHSRPVPLTAVRP